MVAAVLPATIQNLSTIMKAALRALLTLLVFALGASLRAEDFSPEPGFILLLNGKDLTGWHHKFCAYSRWA